MSYKGLNDEWFRRATQFFYRKPSAEMAAAALEYFLHGTSGWAHPVKGPATAFIFCRAAQLHPRAVELYEALRPNLDPDRARYLDVILRTVQSNAVPNPLTMSLATTDDLRTCWMEFGLTGNVAAVQQVVSVLDLDDGLRRRLEEWYRTKGQKWLSKRALRALAQWGISFDEDGDIERDDDVDVHCWLLAERAKVMSLRQLPITLDEVELERIALKGTAIWSLDRRGREHELVRRCCLSEATQEGGSARFLLADVGV